MSPENVQIIRSVYDAVNRGDWDAAFRDQSPDVELRLPPGPNADRYRGRDECQGYFQDMLTPFATFSAEAEELFDAGDQIAVVVKTRARPAASAAEIEIRNGHLWSFRDGKVVSLQIFPAPEDALEAAGIRD